MKYFSATRDPHWRTKINFVDENNVVVGYDFSSGCCEQYGWYISNNVTQDTTGHVLDDNSSSNLDEELEGWVFDDSFFEELTTSKRCDEENTAVFRMVKGDQEQFLHLYNMHNGYYSHGFDFKKGDETVKSGRL